MIHGSLHRAEVMIGLAITMAMIQQPLLPAPSPRQLAWHEMEYYAFVHFGPNTFTGVEWGEGREDPKLFNPTSLDCEQWVRTFKEAGMSGVIITAKHHDGFCLWPSKYSNHTVSQSSYRGDVLQELSEACKKHGLKMGVYLSPWDRNHPTYGTPEYNLVFAGMLEEVLTQYGEIFEVWFDGANGEGPNGKRQEYDWDLFVATVRKHQPNAVIFSDAGPDVRWVGNENGFAAPTNWATIDRKRYVPGTPLYRELTEGTEGAPDWVPAECDVSIRPGWFYHSDQDTKVKSVRELMDIWYGSIGQNAALLLNVPPDRRGLIHEIDAARLLEFRKERDRHFGNDLMRHSFGVNELTDGKTETFKIGDSVTVKFDNEVTFNRIQLREAIPFGQRVKRFEVWAVVGGSMLKIGEGTTIGYSRILKLPRSSTSVVEVKILDTIHGTALISEMSLYDAPED